MMLSGLLVTTAWRVLRLRMEEKASRYGGYLRIDRTSSRGQPTRCGTPAWGLGVRVTIHRKISTWYKCYTGRRTWWQAVVNTVMKGGEFLDQLLRDSAQYIGINFVSHQRPQSLNTFSPFSSHKLWFTALSFVEVLTVTFTRFPYFSNFIWRLDRQYPAVTHLLPAIV
jgi:hypothetical protein